MMIGYIDYVEDVPAGAKTSQADPPARPSRSNNVGRALRVLNGAAARQKTESR
jgi:hypothetical protein